LTEVGGSVMAFYNSTASTCTTSSKACHQQQKKRH